MNSFRHYINILNEDPSIKDMANILIRDCKPWLDATKNGYYKVYRGLKNFPNDTFFKREIRIDRRPKDSRMVTHNAINQIIKNKGLVADRENSVFVTGNRFASKTYGAPFIFIPIGNFSYTWSPQISDAYNDIDRDFTYGIDFFNFKDIEVAKNHVKDSIKQHIKSLDLRIDKYLNQLKILYDDTDKSSRFLERQIENIKDDIQYSKERIEYFSSQEYFDFELKHSKRWEVNNNNIVLDFDKFNEKYKDNFIGDDGSLSDAIISEHEIMIHAIAGYYIDESTYQIIFNTIST